MTNQELYKEINKLEEKLDKMQETQTQMYKEFYLFKGKAFGFITFLSVLFAFLVEIVKLKL